MAWVDFAAIRENVSVVTVLDKLGMNPRQVENERWRARCPLPSHKGERDSLSLNTAKNVWFCFSCGLGGNVIDLMAKTENLPPKQAAQKLVELMREAPEGAPPAPKEPPAEAKEPEKKGYMKAVDDWLGEVLFAKPDETEAEWFNRARKAIKDKLLESYKNGKLAKA